MPEGKCRRCGEPLNTDATHGWYCENEDCDEYVPPSDIDIDEHEDSIIYGAMENP